MKTTERRTKENYNKSGKLAKRRQARRQDAIGRQKSRLMDLYAAYETEHKANRQYANLDAAVEHATKTLNSL